MIRPSVPLKLRNVYIWSAAVDVLNKWFELQSGLITTDGTVGATLNIYAVLPFPWVWPCMVLELCNIFYAMYILCYVCLNTFIAIFQCCVEYCHSKQWLVLHCVPPTPMYTVRWHISTYATWGNWKSPKSRMSYNVSVYIVVSPGTGIRPGCHDVNTVR